LARRSDSALLSGAESGLKDEKDEVKFTAAAAVVNFRDTKVTTFFKKCRIAQGPQPPSESIPP
jgi:hypothetical protein